MLPETLICWVMAVTDGDTLKMRCEGMSSQKPLIVRIAAIDAPETGQPYGKRSRQSLNALCFRQNALVAPRAHDRYGRLVADVQCNGQDAGLTQVARGMAWAWGRGQRDAAVKVQQEMAQAENLGLWAGKNPIAPWIWRKDNPLQH